MIHYTMNIRQTMLHLSGGLLLLLAPACTSEVDLEGGQPLEVTAEIVSSLSTRAVDATNYDKSSFSTDDEIQINGGSQTVTYRKDATNGWIPKTAGRRFPDHLRLLHSRPHIRQLSPLFCKTRNHIRISGKAINWRRKVLTLP